MAGRLGLSSPWARQAITLEGRALIESLIPDGITLGIGVTPNHDRWELWTVEAGQPSAKLRVSSRMPLVEACRFALRHWGLMERVA